jgi:hypothetical protein
MEKTYPAGVIRVKLASETSAVTLPPIRVVLPAKVLTTIVKTNARIFDTLRRKEFFMKVQIPFCG